MLMPPEPGIFEDVLKLNAAEEVDSICACIRQTLAKDLRRRGLIVALSGGIDSSVTTALAVRAIGPERVLVLLMPERHSAPETLALSRMVAETFSAPYTHEDISAVLQAVGFYQRYDEAVRQVIPEYGESWQSKIVIPSVFAKRGFSLYSIVAQDPQGHEIKKRLPLKAYLEIVAATNFKQRIRKMMEYYHADRLNYAVAGTPNRLEYDQGFFVKLGDGAADIKPIAHLYKSQVYQIAAYLGVPGEVLNRPPTTDTYSLAQGQDEFYFSLPYREMDLCLYGRNNGIDPSIIGEAIGLTAEQVQRVYDDIDAKRSTTRYLHLSPVLTSKVEEIQIS
jgi:NAD+ synthase